VRSSFLRGEVEVVFTVIFIFSTEAERGLGKGRRRQTPRERSSFLSVYFQHGGGEGLGEGQEEANTQEEVVFTVILIFQHTGGEGLEEGQEEAKTQGEVVISVIIVFSTVEGRRRQTPRRRLSLLSFLFLARGRRGIGGRAGGGQHSGRGRHYCNFISSTEAERDWVRGKRRPTPRERSSLL
jgi:hypothetical protein